MHALEILLLAAAAVLWAIGQRKTRRAPMPTGALAPWRPGALVAIRERFRGRLLRHEPRGGRERTLTQTRSRRGCPVRCSQFASGSRTTSPA